MKARILVIEDEPAINNLLCMNLEVTGYQTVSYLDGNDASEGIAWDHEFQCALVDIMLPGKDGYTLLPELNHYGIPVLSPGGPSLPASRRALQYSLRHLL